MKILEGLFKWSHEVVLKDSMGEPITYKDESTGELKPITVFQRVIGDAEVDLARQTALRASALKRKNLNNPANLDRMALIPEFAKLDKDSLIGVTVLNEITDFRAQASRELRFPFPEELSGGASLKEQEQYQEAVDTYFTRREEAVVEKTRQLVETRTQELTKFSKKKLQQIYEEVSINGVCRDAMLITFNEFVTYLATYDTEEFTNKAFSSFAAFRNANTSVKSQLMEAYLQLELSGDQLKK